MTSPEAHEAIEKVRAEAIRKLRRKQSWLITLTFVGEVAFLYLIFWLMQYQEWWKWPTVIVLVAVMALGGIMMMWTGAAIESLIDDVNKRRDGAK